MFHVRSKSDASAAHAAAPATARTTWDGLTSNIFIGRRRLFQNDETLPIEMFREHLLKKSFELAML